METMSDGQLGAVRQRNHDKGCVEPSEAQKVEAKKIQRKELAVRLGSNWQDVWP